MDWQTITAAAIVLVTLVIFVARLVFTRNSSGCGHGCGCDKPDEISPQLPSILTRRAVETQVTTPSHDSSPSARDLK